CSGRRFPPLRRKAREPRAPAAPRSLWRSASRDTLALARIRRARRRSIRPASSRRAPRHPGRADALEILREGAHVERGSLAIDIEFVDDRVHDAVDGPAVGKLPDARTHVVEHVELVAIDGDDERFAIDHAARGALGLLQPFGTGPE